MARVSAFYVSVERLRWLARLNIGLVAGLRWLGRPPHGMGGIGKCRKIIGKSSVYLPKTFYSLASRVSHLNWLGEHPRSWMLSPPQELSRSVTSGKLQIHRRSVHVVALDALAYLIQGWYLTMRLANATLDTLFTLSSLVGCSWTIHFHHLEMGFKSIEEVNNTTHNHGFSG